MRTHHVWEAEDVCVLPPGTFIACYLVWQRNVADVLKSRVLGRGDYPESSGWAQGHSEGP